MGVEEVRWDKGGTVREGDCNFYMEMNRIVNGNRSFVQHSTVSAVETVEFVRERVTYSVLRGRYFNIVVLNVQALCKGKRFDSKDSLYGELEQVFYQFPMYHMKIPVGDFNTKVGRENIFNPTIVNECLLQVSNDNGVRVVNFEYQKVSLLRAQFSHTKTFISTPVPLLMGRTTTRLFTF